MKVNIFTLINDVNEPIVWTNLDELLNDLAVNYCGFHDEWDGEWKTLQDAQDFVDENDLGTLEEEVQDIQIFTLVMIGSEDDDFHSKVENFPTLEDAKKYINDNYTNEGQDGEENEILKDIHSVDGINYFLMKECDSKDRLHDSKEGK